MPDKEKTTSEIMMDITAHYLVNGCDECCFLTVAETCDTIPSHCCWMRLYAYFKAKEAKEAEKEEHRDG